MINAVKQLDNNASLWRVFEVIKAHYAKTPIDNTSEAASLLPVQCMLSLLSLLDYAAYSSFEKSCLQTAQTYWLENAKELESDMMQQCNTLATQIDYRSKQQNYRKICLAQVLSIDSDHFNDLPDFFETIYLAGLPVDTILETVRCCFAHISELEHLS